MSQKFTLEDISVFLPSYLTDDSAIRAEIKNFTSGQVVTSLYSLTSSTEQVVLQGDGLQEIPISKLPEPKVETAKAIVVSNTCDIDPSNKRNFPAMLVYAPIFDLQKYKASLSKRNIPSDKIGQHIDAIRRQYVTQIFYLPAVTGLEGESIVFLDRVSSCNVEHFDTNTLLQERLFSLSDFGHYLFLFKLSIHFTRLTAEVERGPSQSVH